MTRSFTIDVQRTVLMGEAQHLREIRQRAFATVVLPIGIGDETNGSIESEIGWYRRLMSLGS
jgi:hypothetical protein